MIITDELRASLEGSRQFAQLINEGANIRTNLLMHGAAYDDYEQLLYDNVLEFLCSLSVIDGEVNNAEVQFINSLLGISMNIDDVKKRADESVANSACDTSWTPQIIRCFCLLDKMNPEPNPNATSAELAISLFESLGFEMIISDSDMQKAEIDWVLSKKDQMLDVAKAELGFYYTGLAERNGALEEYREKIRKVGKSPTRRLDGVASISNLISRGLGHDSAGKASKFRQNVDNQENGITTAPNEKTLEDLLSELNSLIGLHDVKQDVRSMINLMKIRKVREERGMQQPPMSLHLVFSGNPGTGKTTIARLLSEIYRSIGLLSRGHLVETDRAGLVGGYVGQTAIKTKEVISAAQGGMLFIDEAYTLSSNKKDGDYGQEAIDTLLKEMEDNRDDFIVVVAGYPELMQEFLYSNPGMESRFNKFIHFADYSSEELLDIFLMLCKKNSLELSEKAHARIKDLFIDIVSNKPENFSNGREVRNVFERVLTNQANRLSTMEAIDDQVLSMIEYEDVAPI